MDLYFYFIQLIGFIAWILLALSYYRKDTNHILVFQIISTILFCLHYFLLGAYSGLLICIYEVVRDYSYYRSDLDDYIFLGSILVYGISAYVTFTTVLDVFPYIASLIDGYFLTKKRITVVLGAIVTYTLWLIYDLYAKSYSGAITDAIIILSNIYILLFRKDKEKIIVSKTPIIK
jgi:hypothetical protein